MLLDVILISVLVHSTASAPPDCLESNVNSCLKSFRDELDAGVRALEDANDTVIAQVCWRYRVASDCITPFMYFCPFIKKSLHNKLEAFEFACFTDRSEAKNWPFMPTPGPKDGSANELEEAFAAQEQEVLIDSAIKACIAAGVTIFLIFLCFMADCISKCRVQMRVNRATAAAAEYQQEKEDAENDEEALIADDTQTKKV